MDSPQRKESEILNNLKAKSNSLERKRTRTSLLLAACIATAIKNKGWNKQTFAEKMNKKPSVITRWLSGTHNFTSDTLSDIEEILGIDLLVFGKKETNPIIIVGTFQVSINVNISLNVFQLTPMISYSDQAIAVKGNSLQNSFLNTTLLCPLNEN